MNLKYLITIILFTIISQLIFPQDDKTVVARVGNDNITAREFKLRMELSPYIPKEKNMPKDSVKYDFLYSLIAEKLWALKAQENGLENSREFSFFFKPVEELYVRDALFKMEIESRVNISASEMEKGIYKSQFSQRIRFFSSIDSVSISRFCQQLSDSAKIDSFLALNNNIGVTLVTVKFGDLESESTEDTVYSLKKGSFSTPKKVPGGWILYYCTDNIFTPINIADQKTVDGIKEKIKNRKLEIQYNEYRDKLLSGTNIKLNSQAIINLSKQLWKILKFKKPIPESKTPMYQVEENDFKNVLASYPQDQLKTVVFNLKDKKIYLFDLLSKVAYNGFGIPALDSNLVLSRLVTIAKQFVEEQILTEEGYKKGYNLLPEVQSDLKVWKQKYLAQMYASASLDSIHLNDNQLKDYYNSIFQNSSNQQFVKLLIITLSDLDEMSKLLSRMNNGESFNELAMYYGKTDTLADKNGETGLVPVRMLHDLGNYVSGMHKGEIFGPVKRLNGYSIFQLIDTIEKPDSTIPAFETVKNQLRSNLRYKILTDKLNNITANSSVQNDVKIYKNVVDKIQTSQIPMIVHRYMGFGGTIIGVPLTTPFSGWINNEIKHKLLP